MKPFKLGIYKYDAKKEEHIYFPLGRFDTIKECIKYAKFYSKTDSYFKTFKWEKFDQISYCFEITEYRIENIDGIDFEDNYASANLEEVIYEKCENLSMFVKY